MARRPPLLRAVANALQQHRWLKRFRRILVGVSGGPDSVALLLALRELAQGSSTELIVAHLHHGIRGAAADSDAHWVRDLAHRLGLRCTVGRARVPVQARREGRSLEEAARRARLDFLARCARRYAADAVALAHTADDQAETVLMRLLHGAGLEGLAGMGLETRIGSLTILRPFLDVRRAQIEQWLRTIGQDWRTDTSNRELRWLRNRIRHRVLPYLTRQLRRDVVAALARSASRLAADEELIAAYAQREWRRRQGAEGSLLTRNWARVPVALQRRVVQLWLLHAGLNLGDAPSFRLVESVRDLAAGRTPGPIHLSPNWEVVHQEGRLRLRRRTQQVQTWKPTPVQCPGQTEVPEAGYRLTMEATRGWQPVNEPGPGTCPTEAWVRRPSPNERHWVLRPWRAGDRYQPLGAPGHMKVSDIFINRKVARSIRVKWPILTCNGEIVWLPGHRIADTWKVPSPTAPSLHLRLEPLSLATSSDRADHRP